MAKENITWNRPAAPPPPMFFGKKERDFVKQINDEVTECIMPQVIIYYPISVKNSNFHELYGEAIEKTYLPPVRVATRVYWDEGRVTTTEKHNIDSESRITVRFQKRRITEDLDLFVRQGDIIFYGNQFYEIQKTAEPDELFGQADFRFEVTAECLRVRGGQFDEPGVITQARELFRTAPAASAEEVSETLTIGCNGKIQILSAKDTSSDFPTVQDMINNPTNYSGCVVYITEVGTTLYPPFDRADKLYFNEGGVWFASPFILST